MEKVAPIHLLRPNHNHAATSLNQITIIIMPHKPIYPIRRTIRIPEYDYTQQCAYFITICTHRKENIFGEIKSGIMKLSNFGEIAYYQWLQLPNRFSNINLDTFVIMPNHIHGIIIIKEKDPSRRGEAGENSPVPSPKNPISPASPSLPSEDSPQVWKSIPCSPSITPPPRGTTPGSISAIIQNYKSLTTRKINMLRRTKNKITWQRNYYEHIIRDENDHDRIVEYMENNPSSWSDDKYFAG